MAKGRQRPPVRSVPCAHARLPALHLRLAWLAADASASSPLEGTKSGEVKKTARAGAVVGLVVGPLRSVPFRPPVDLLRDLPERGLDAHVGPRAGLDEGEPLVDGEAARLAAWLSVQAPLESQGGARKCAQVQPPQPRRSSLQYDARRIVVSTRPLWCAGALPGAVAFGGRCAVRPHVLRSVRQIHASGHSLGGGFTFTVPCPACGFTYVIAYGC